MPKLIRLYVRQVVAGFGISAAFVVLLLAFDVANLRHLVTHTSAGPLAVFLLWVFNGIVFAGVQFGISIMRMAEPEPRGPGGGRPRNPVSRVMPLPASRPVPVPADDSRG